MSACVSYVNSMSFNTCALNGELYLPRISLFRFSRRIKVIELNGETIYSIMKGFKDFTFFFYKTVKNFLLANSWFNYEYIHKVDSLWCDEIQRPKRRKISLSTYSMIYKILIVGASHFSIL